MTTDANRGSVIQEFYRGTNILITGGTGLMGKVLTEKLLRSCPNLNSIYLLIRTKKGKDVGTRLNDLFEEPVFDRLKIEQPGFRDKVVAVAGDCAEKDLGLSPQDRQRLADSVDVVFNLAATVRFDEHLRTAVYTNVRSALYLIQLCKECVHLKVLIHLSTAYSHSYRRYIGEVIYDPPMTAEDVIKLVECLNDDTLTNVTPGLLGQWCNTYTFTKAISEHAVRNNNLSCPVGLFRPSIVHCTAQEPLPGWIDKPSGPTIAFVRIGMGFQRVSINDSTAKASFVPCDMSVNAIIASAWDVCQRGKPGREEISVYNSVSTCDNPVIWKQASSYVLKHFSKCPFDDVMWMPFNVECLKLSYYKFFAFFLHTLPALLMDILLFCKGQETKMMKMYKKLDCQNEIIGNFSKYEWEFDNDNVRKMWTNISDEDRNIFHFDIGDLNWHEYFCRSVEGYRQFLLKQDPKNLPKAMEHAKRMKRIHMVTTFSIIAFILWLIWSVFLRQFL
ncbi:fatty acyl-CoA reductase wat-like [Periplaneta americana]|uniref:fatty acyl-CoA reductase wat-like n=1 Tax=Periplaneta americana TaxID=6978 RepID=UPI0037E79AF9